MRLAFRDPKLRRLWTAQAFGAVGDELFRVAMVWLAVGAIGGFAAWLPALQSGVVIAGALIAGGLAGADALTMAKTNLIRAIAALAPVVWVLAGGGLVVALVLAAMVLSATRTIFDPALQTSLGRLARDDEILRSANGLFDSTYRMARLVGPMLAAVLAIFVPVIDLLTINAALLLAGAWAIFSLRRDLPPFARDRAQASIVTGLRIVAAHKLLRVLMTLGMVNNATWVVTITVGLALLIDQRAPILFGLPGAGIFGLVFAAYGLGNITGNLIAVSRARPPGLPLMFASVLLVHSCMGLMGVAGLHAGPSQLAPVLMALAAIGAMGPAFFDIPYQMIIQRQATQHVAAVFRVKMLSSNIGVLTGLLAAPWMFDRFGPSWVIIGLGIASVAATALAWMIASRAIRADASA